MKHFCFTVDDNIRFLRELTEGDYGCIFDHPYLAMYKRMHEKYGVAVQLNLFYEAEDFDLSRVTDRFSEQWQACADWLKLSFHSRLENVRPYELSAGGEVAEDCRAVHKEILRFASKKSLAKTTTVHYCLATEDGIAALYENGVRGLLGLYGTDDTPRVSYQSTPAECEKIRKGEVVCRGGMSYAAIDIVLNTCSKEEIICRLRSLLSRERIGIMIHEQYFYPDYRKYQIDFEKKLDAAFGLLTENGYKSLFFEEEIN